MTTQLKVRQAKALVEDTKRLVQTTQDAASAGKQTIAERRQDRELEQAEEIIPHAR